MSYADVVSQMQAIQTQLVQLGLVRPAPSVASASTFASALDDASAVVSTSATAATDGTLIAPNGTTGDDVVQAALAYKGVPYVLGGESKSGIDCSGLVQAAFGNLGISVPRLVHEQQTVGQEVGSLKDAKPGDLIVLNGSDHIAIWMGDGTAIHAPYPGRTVSVQKAWFDDGDITTIRRVVPASGDAPAPAASGVPAAALGAGAGAGGIADATVLKASAMLATSGADVGLYSPTATGASGSGGGASLGSLLASFGLAGSSSTTGSSSTSAQQIIAARAALLGTSA